MKGKKKVGEHGKGEPGPTCWHCGQQGHVEAHCTYNGATTKYGMAATEKVAPTSVDSKGRASMEAKGKAKVERCKDPHLKNPLVCWHCGQQGHGMAKSINSGASMKYGARLALAEASRVGGSALQDSKKKKKNPQRWKKPSEASRPLKATVSKEGGEMKKTEE